ncbi:MAG: acyl-CoA dehydrogenase [Oscillospiraceae bacterium]|nr:acyl-CoA dehydrogenase [Oscillospiraceae bacterium]
MNFHLTPQQEAFKAVLRKFAEEKIEPIAFQLDTDNRFPEEIVKELGQMSVLGTPYAKEYGGAGRDVLSYVLAVEELSRIDAGVGVILSAHVSLGSWPILAYGTEAQKQKYLVPLASGKKLGAFGLTETNAGSDAGKTETTAVLQGDHYLLNGSKIFITNGGYADTYIVFAITTPGTGTKGISAFLVEKGWEGFTFGTHYNKMGIRSSATAELLFRDVKVPKENLLGQEGKGFSIAMATLEGGRIGIAAQALGIAQGAFEKALAYSKERIQFGQPISGQQVVAFKLADMATKIRAARFMVYSAAESKENHEPYGMESAMAKQYASDVCLEVVNDAVQIFGGSGYIKGFPVERMYRDAKICTIYEGTNEIQRLVISQFLIGKTAKPAEKAPAPAAPEQKTEGRKRILFRDGNATEKVEAFIQAIGLDKLRPSFSSVDAKGSIVGADRVCSVGLGLASKEDLVLIEALAESLHAVVGCSRPFAEDRGWLPIDHFVGLSGQKFTGSLYVAIGISGQIQHLKGIETAGTVVAINADPGAPIFEHADYGIVGDLYELVPLLTERLKQ